MREIIPKQLWIGNVSDTDNPSQLLNMGISALIDLAYEELPPTLPRDLIYCRFPLIDGSENPVELLRAAIDVTAHFIRSETLTLVYCGAGMSRSPCVVAAALSTIREQPAEDCLMKLTEGVPHDVSPTLWADVISALQR